MSPARQERAAGLRRYRKRRCSQPSRIHSLRKEAGEYRVMGIYPQGHLMEFVRPSLNPQVLPAAAVDYAREGEEVLVAGWPIARQHPKGQAGTVFSPSRTRPATPR